VISTTPICGRAARTSRMPLRDDPQRVDVEAGVGLVEDRDVRLEDRHLHDLVALLLAAAEALVEVAVDERAVHAEPLHPLHRREAQLEHDRSTPLRADSAWRRNWMTETPGISCGYWNARNMPAFARTSVGQLVTSSPWNRIRPP
jgi:hypothetical protein